MEKMIRLIGIDLDGTLLNNNKEITYPVKKSIQDAIGRGIIVVPVTGRPISGLQSEFQTLFRESYAITSNGAVITKLSDNSIVHRSSLSKETSLKILESLKVHNVIVEVFYQGFGFTEYRHYKKIMKKYENTSLYYYLISTRKIIECLTRFVKDQTDYIEDISVMTDSIEQRNEIEDDLRGFNDIIVTSSIKTDLEINHKDANKGAALNKLAAHLGISPGETMAIGDSGNDLTMLENAGISIAMENADIKIKKIADYITGSNEEDGVAKAINKYILNIAK